jgi:tRNA threonylcarbamoyladenosine biosynthesis protein TsaB
MKVLALDTTTRAGSVALIVDERVVDERAGDASRTHVERLPAEIVALAAAHDLAVADVDLFAVASGPGSFTGLRIGIATMQGLAFGSHGLPGGSIVAAWMNAHRHEIFAALYRVTGEAGAASGLPRLMEVEGASVGAPEITLARWLENGTRASVFAGDGAVLYREVISSSMPAGRVVPAPSLAGAIGRLAASGAHGAGASPAAIQPFYVRRPDVEIARDEKLR